MEAIGLTGEVACWEPEFIHNSRERTNVDMAWWDVNNGPTYCEVKLTEREFGPASEKTNEDRRKYDEKRTEFYLPGLQGKCPDEFLERNFFLKNYQIFRNLWLATTSDKATLVFLMPRANYRLWDQLNPIVDRLGDSLKSRIRIVAIEDVLKSLAIVHSPAWVSKYAMLLRAKYLLPT
ncbi:MAG TPA: hypothetical protein VHY19_09815 [Steroidobacteraceae bacterium]|jgi:hypothetical protein|nr:hypothetical protein [Steroidobacteraceae bacterium]